MKSKGTRTYNMTARAAAAAETHRKLIEAGSWHLATSGYDDLLLADVARSAGVTIQTLLRRFGSKEGLLEAVLEAGLQDVRAARSVSEPGDVHAAIDVLMRHYEEWGERSIKLLAQEERTEAARRVTTAGKQLHSDWVDAVFEPQLSKASAEGRERLRARLIVCTDVYVWKVLRRHLGFDEATTRTTILELVLAVLA